MDGEVMSSRNDCVWLALHAGELSRAQLDALDLSALRSFEPKGMGYCVEMWKDGEIQERTDAQNAEKESFIKALYTASSRVWKDGS